MLTYPSKFYEAFTGEEMQILGAHVYGFQKLPKNSPLHSTSKPGPWTPYERLLRAVKALAEAGVEFRTARYEAPMNRIQMEGMLDPATTKESKEVFEKIIVWDEEYLSGLVAGYGGKFNDEQCGFAKCEPESLMGGKKRLIAISQKPKEVSEPEEVRRGPGRPPKVAI